MLAFQPRVCTGLPRSVKSQGKTKFFQGQGKVSEVCIWLRKFGILLKVREVYIILDIMSTKSQEQRKEIENEESISNV